MRRLRETFVAGIFSGALALAAWTTLSSAQTPGAGPPADFPPPGRNGPSNGPPGHGGRGSNAMARLGKAIFFDKNISNPAGMSCANCHAPETGFSNPNSSVNLTYGTVPGIIPSRFGNRKPMTLSYSWFVPEGPAFFNRRNHAWEGGFFYDGRAETLEDQARGPMLNPNEMDNVAHGLGSPDMVVHKAVSGSYANLFAQAFGNDALSKPSDEIFGYMRQALEAYEQSREVSPFSSKYDAYVQGRAQLTTSEMNGLRLFTGSTTGRPGGPANYKSAQCITCHTISDSDNGRRDFFTNWTYANIGVPKNQSNPFYKQTNAASDPQGYNPDGDRYVDLGLGAVLYPRQKLPPGNMGPGSDGRGDFLRVNGEFRVASLRNVDKRPNASFVKAYMHNGVFKSLKTVVHFYNTRNLTIRNEIIDLSDPAANANLRGERLWPVPEYASPVTLQNPSGRPGSRGARVGNLGLTDGEENDIVAFLQTLTDGYFTPDPRRPPPPPN